MNDILDTETAIVLLNNDISFWPVDDKHCWIQTKLPRLSKILSEYNGSKLVAWGVAGGYLRTYEVKLSLTGCAYFLKNLKYVKSLMNTRAEISTMGQESSIGA